jgi:hypothetical protein
MGNLTLEFLDFKQTENLVVGGKNVCSKSPIVRVKTAATSVGFPFAKTGTDNTETILNNK